MRIYFHKRKKHKQKIAFVYTQETLSEDFEALKKVLRLSPALHLPDDEVQSHRTPDGFSKHLSAEAESNLRAWYANDIEIYDYCCELRAELLAELLEREFGTIHGGGAVDRPHRRGDLFAVLIGHLSFAV